MPSAASADYQVVLHTPDAPLRERMVRALAAHGIQALELAEDARESNSRLDGLILDGTVLAVPPVLAAARQGGWLRPGTPVFALIGTTLPAEEQVAWLRAGVWEFIRLPLDEEIAGLQVRNTLRGHRPAAGGEPYSRKALALVAAESIALAVRASRPLTAAALALDWSEHRTLPPGRSLLLRLAEATSERMRRSDLVGITANGSLLVLLPDTDVTGGGVFLSRLTDFLAARLREWGVAARLRTALVTVDLDDPPPPDGLLDSAEHALG